MFMLYSNNVPPRGGSSGRLYFSKGMHNFCINYANEVQKWHKTHVSMKSSLIQQPCSSIFLNKMLVNLECMCSLCVGLMNH